MRRIVIILIAVSLLWGCAAENRDLSKALEMRNKLIQSQGCSFDAVITADYGEYIHSFEMQCKTDSASALNFTVTKPDSICGLSGQIEGQKGSITFEDQVLSFPTLAEGQISPVSAPWVFYNTLKNGYFRSCAKEKQGYQLCLDDSYNDSSLQLDIWTDENFQPIRADILWQGRRILCLSITNYQIL